MAPRSCETPNYKKHENNTYGCPLMWYELATMWRGQNIEVYAKRQYAK